MVFSYGKNGNSKGCRVHTMKHQSQVLFNVTLPKEEPIKITTIIDADKKTISWYWSGKVQNTQSYYGDLSEQTIYAVAGCY